MIKRLGDRPTDVETVDDADAADPSNPWMRVLGILVLGSFAAATKTARAPRRSNTPATDPATDPATTPSTGDVPHTEAAA